MGTASRYSSLVKQIVNQFQETLPPPLPASNSMGSSSLHHSLLRQVKGQPVLQPGRCSPIKKSPSTSSTGSTKRGPPPTPQRASSIRSSSGETQDERPKKVESLVNKFGQAPQTEFHHPPKVAVVNPQPQMQPHQQPATSSLTSSSWKHSSLKKGAVPPPTLNRRTSNSTQYDNTTSMPLSPPPLSQTPPPSLSSYSSSSSPAPPTSPKSAGPGSLALKPHFLEDLNRTLKRKSVSRHGSLTSSHLIPSSKMEPVGTMDDMALLPPPPPELLLQQQQQGVRGHSHTLSRHHTHSHSTKHANISGYATLRRGPPPAPPKRDQSTKLTSEW
ncbi:ras-associated and pleckstrin homology domains-containing protein 1a isoform X1 [Lates japonicus]|uniref:Ras-associated and pleckstrin homology domains-containing protein 1a isoform X1 n=1 Tax=Lates japonicus TaxID=270547 RepID=A0AAD3N4G3_LATJO|nr:ras-associated and pleckstrin homology domains-containing protein 1a isoform X1 [Lates japonicus]